MTLKFTAKERDAESGRDYFGARYYGSALGRFTSPDPSGLLAQKPQDPQSWNLYAYARNNSLANVDPDWLDCIYATLPEPGFTTWITIAMRTIAATMAALGCRVMSTRTGCTTTRKPRPLKLHLKTVIRLISLSLRQAH